MSSRKHHFLSYNTLKISPTSKGDHYGRWHRLGCLPPLIPHPRFCAERLQSLIRTLELSRLDEHSALQKVASFATLVATYEKGELTCGDCNCYCITIEPSGFLLILEPFETDNATVPNPVFHFTSVFWPMNTSPSPEFATGASIPRWLLSRFLSTSAVLSLLLERSHR